MKVGGDRMADDLLRSNVFAFHQVGIQSRPMQNFLSLRLAKGTPERESLEALLRKGRVIGGRENI